MPDVKAAYSIDCEVEAQEALCMAHYENWKYYRTGLAERMLKYYKMSHCVGQLPCTGYFYYFAHGVASLNLPLVICVPPS